MKPTRPPLTVVKIGGSLLRDRESLISMARAVAERRRAGERLLLVVSALQGVTDLLEQGALRALEARSNGAAVGTSMDLLRRRHGDLVPEGVEFPEARACDRFRTVETVLESIRDNGRLAEPVLARLLAEGERLSALLIAAVLRSLGGPDDAGVDARAVDSEEAGLRAVGNPVDGRCDIAASEPGLRRLMPELERRVLVLTGFFGINASGEVVLFGRGGTDHSASAVAAALRAPRLELWKDVGGYLNADPRVVRSATTVPELSFAEVHQLAELGSTVLHPQCLAPLQGLEIETLVRSSTHTGTRLVPHRRGGSSRVAAVVSRPGRVEMELDVGAIAHEVGRWVIRTLRDAEIEPLEVRQRHDTLRLALGADQLEVGRRALRSTLDGRYSELAVTTIPPLVGAVGEGVGRRRDVAERLLEGLRRSGVRSLERWPGVTAAGVAFTVHPGDRLRGLSWAYETFFGNSDAT